MTTDLLARRRRPLALITECTTVWCTRHDYESGVCDGKQATLGDHAVILTQSPDEPASVYVSLNMTNSVPMAPAEAIEFARLMVAAAQTAMDAERTLAA